MENAFPAYLTNQGVFLFLIHFCFVALIFLGQYFFFLYLNGRRPLFAHPLLESFLYFPFFLFPLGMFFSWLSLGNVFYGAVQLFLVFFAVLGMQRYFRNGIFQRLRSVGGMEWLIYGLIAMVAFFGWAVPIPDGWNGHGHVLWNTLTRMLRTGGYPFYGREALVSDDLTQLFFPYHFTFFLRLYCADLPLFFTRPAFLVTLPAGFLLVRAVKDICGTFRFPRAAGLLGLLAVMGTYWNSMIFYEIQYDTLALLMLLYAFWLFGKIVVEKKPYLLHWVLLLSFSFLIRTQIFVILFIGSAILLFLYFRRLKGLFRLRPLFGIVAFLPVALWLAFAWGRFGHPLWPMSRGVVSKIFKNDYKQPTVSTAEMPLSKRPVVERGGGAESQKYGARAGPFVERIRALLPVQSGMGILLFIIRAGPLALFLSVLFFISAHRRKGDPFLKPFLAVEAAFFFGWLAEYAVFYWGNNKFPQYLSAVLVLPAGLLLESLRRRFFRPIHVPIALYFFLAFNVALFGRARVDFSFKPARILFGEADFTEKLAYRSSRTVEETRRGIAELQAAYASGKRILHMDVEPGGLLPSLMGREYFGEMLYFYPNDYRLRDLLVAKDKQAFVSAFEKLDIGAVFFPQRVRAGMESHPLLTALGELKTEGKYRLVVPAREVLEKYR